MYKNLLFVTFLLSCTTAMTSQEENQPIIQHESAIEKACRHPDIRFVIFEYLIDTNELLDKVAYEALTQYPVDWKTVKTIASILNFYPRIDPKNPKTDPKKALSLPRYCDAFRDYRYYGGYHNLLHIFFVFKNRRPYDPSCPQNEDSIIVKLLCNNNIDVNGKDCSGATGRNY
jgi:hypothetical protein